MPTSTRFATITAQAALLILTLAAPHASAAAQPDAPDAAACLARPTVTCSVDLALAASAGSGQDEDYDRARLVIAVAQRIKDIAARKAYLDGVTGRFFADGSLGRRLVGDKRRVADIAAAIVARDNATADRLLGETQANFQRWWKTLGAVMSALADAGKPDLAVATEAKYHRAVNVNLSDALGRNLGHEVWNTQQQLARALVRCACGPDPLAMVLALPRQKDRLRLAATLYARRHDLKDLKSFLTHEFGKLGAVKDETQRQWVGYAFGLLLQELPPRDIPAAVRAAPHWLTADDFVRQAESGMSTDQNIYSAVLVRVIKTGDRRAVAAIAKLRPRGDTIWLESTEIDKPDAAMKVENALPKPERERLRALIVKSMLGHGDVRKGMKLAMKGPIRQTWRMRQLEPEDEAAFEDAVLTPLLTRGAFDLAEDAIKGMRDAESRKAMQEEIDDARKKRASQAAPMDAAAILAARWAAYQQSKKDSKSGEAFLDSVRDLLAKQPDAFPLK